MNLELLASRLWRRVAKGGPDDCWLFNGPPASNGYGQLMVQYQNILPHRAAFAVTYGYWPYNSQHTCDNRMCCNPNHLYDGTPTSNNHDAGSRNRWNPKRGDSHPHSKLTSSQVLEIRARHRGGERVTALAKIYGVSQPAISDIIRRRNWKQLEELT